MAKAFITTAHGRRINAAKNAVYDIHFDGRYQATVEVVSEPVGGRTGLIVVFGALQPRGKELALEAIAQYVAEKSNV